MKAICKNNLLYYINDNCSFGKDYITFDKNEIIEYTVDNDVFTVSNIVTMSKFDFLLNFEIIKK